VETAITMPKTPITIAKELITMARNTRILLRRAHQPDEAMR
jgi:hypothetical protein